MRGANQEYFLKNWQEATLFSLKDMKVMTKLQCLWAWNKKKGQRKKLKLNACLSIFLCRTLFLPFDSTDPKNKDESNLTTQLLALQNFNCKCKSFIGVLWIWSCSDFEGLRILKFKVAIPQVHVKSEIVWILRLSSDRVLHSFCSVLVSSIPLSCKLVRSLPVAILPTKC